MTQQQGTELLSMRVGTQEFAVDIMSVREIRGWTSSTPMPHAPATVKGMINLRGTVLPILDLGARLGLADVEPAPSAVVVVVECAGTQTGLLVDAVCDIVAITADQIQPTPDVGLHGEGAVSGLVMLDGRIVGILSLPAVLPQTRAAA